MTMTNAEWMIQQGYKFSDLWMVRDCQDYYDDSDRTYIITINGKDLYKYIATNELSYLEVMLKWLDMEHKEHKEPILDDAEKKYLSKVLGPVRNNVYRIRKVCNAYESREFIAVQGFFGGSNCTFLQDFEPGTMFKGMEPNRWYSLGELGLLKMQSGCFI